MITVVRAIHDWNARHDRARVTCFCRDLVRRGISARRVLVIHHVHEIEDSGLHRGFVRVDRVLDCDDCVPVLHEADQVAPCQDRATSLLSRFGRSPASAAILSS